MINSHKYMILKNYLKDNDDIRFMTNGIKITSCRSEIVPRIDHRHVCQLAIQTHPLLLFYCSHIHLKSIGMYKRYGISWIQKKNSFIFLLKGSNYT